MSNKIIIALRRHYHCEHARLVLQQHALPYPVYELDEENHSQALMQKVIEQGAEILITGDVYAESIMDQFDISVVTIRRSRIPFSDSIREALKFADRAAIVWRDTDSTAAKKACALFPGAVTFYPYQIHDNFDTLFKKLHKDGIQVIIGAGSLNAYAAKYHMRVVNVPYDEEDILSAVHLAEHNLRSLEERQEHANILNTIQDNIAEGIIFLDSKGVIQTINRSASSIMRLDSKTIQGLSIQKTSLFCDEIHRLFLNFEPFTSKVIYLHGEQFVLEGQPIFVKKIFKSAILTLTPVEKLQITEQRIRKQLLKHSGSASITFKDIIGNSPALTNCIRTAQQYAKVDSAVLVYGQSGTGKEMFVQSIHNASERKNGPFVVINCAALPENLIESELFGYEKGSFTGALSNGKQGLFVKGHQGTIFLDEVSEMPLHVQARFLRVLQEHEVTPIGSSRVIPVDIRIIAATNKNLKDMVKQKLFREDLYYRISVLTMKLPSLNEREDDIKLLIRHFINQKRDELHLDIVDIEPAALEYLSSLHYPGNIRQLSNIVERAMVLNTGNILHLDSAVNAVSMSEEFISSSEDNSSEILYSFHSVDSLQENIIRAALTKNNYNRKATAKELGVSTSTLYRKMKQFNIED